MERSGTGKDLDMHNLLEPGMFVRHPGQPDWGLGQVQSNVGGRVTVNFEHQGKVVIDSRQVELRIVFDLGR
jgi:hypothetical protein